MPCKRNLGWMRLKPEESQQVWYENMLEWFDWLKKEHPESLESHYRVDPSQVRAAMVEGLAGRPLPDFPEFERNFPERHGPSPQRVALTSFKRPTRMQLNKELVKAGQGADPGKELARFMGKAGMAVGDCGQTAINRRLQVQYEKDFEILAVRNEQFVPGKARPVAGAAPKHSRGHGSEQD